MRAFCADESFPLFRSQLSIHLDVQVRQYQNWSLMPFAAVIGSVYPATYVRGSRFGFGLYPGAAGQQICATAAGCASCRQPVLHFGGRPDQSCHYKTV